MTKELIDKIDDILPQTQCGLCTYKGCRPYAEAIVNQKEFIDRCLPGGTKILRELGKLTDQDPEPYLSNMEEKQKSNRVVVIREDECIGCTKCIQACPVDAILGSGKQMHTVIADECTGCELCIAPCPVDCIEIKLLPEPNELEAKQKANLARKRYEFRNYRLEKNETIKKEKFQTLKRQERKAEIEAAILRAKSKKPLDVV